MDELDKFIEEVHNEHFNLASNNCIHKHVRIVNKARELGHDASIMGCLGVVPIKPMGGIPFIWPHVYAKIDDKIVDVSLEPELEKEVWPSKDILRIFPSNLSKLRPMYPGEGPPLPAALPRWPWVKKEAKEG